MEKYLNKGLEEDKVGDDVLGWWKVQGPRYLVVSCMAHDALVVPVSTVALESTFSARRHTLNTCQTYLTTKVFDSINTCLCMYYA